MNNTGALLSLMDNYSRKTYLKYVKNENAENAVKALLEWNATLGLEKKFILFRDGGSHFANELVKELMQRVRGQCKLSVAHIPWSSGSIKNRNTTILKIIRQLHSEFHLAKDEWKEFIPTIMGIMNRRKMPSRKGYTANELFPSLSRGKSVIVNSLPDGLQLLDIGQEETDLTRRMALSR